MQTNAKASLLLGACLAISGSCTALREAAFCQQRPAPVFDLYDTGGQPVRLIDLRGQSILLGFGFAQCGGQCPLILREMDAAIAAARSSDLPIQGYFVTLSPEHDTVEAMRLLEASLDGTVRWLTGSRSAVQKTAADYHSWHYMNPMRAAEPGYQIEHSSSVSLIGPDGRIECVYQDSNQLRERLELDLQRILGDSM